MGLLRIGPPRIGVLRGWRHYVRISTLTIRRGEQRSQERDEFRGRVYRAGTSLLGTGYLRDSLGRIVQLFDTTLGTPKRWSFVYDSVGRLKADSVDGNLFHAFTYDSNGNRLSYTSAGGTVTYRYDAQDRLLASYTAGDSTTYTYGSNGGLKTKTIPGGATTTYTYDALGNMVRVLVPNGAAVDTIDYLIDGQNRRVGRKLNGTVTHRWLYQNQLKPVAELDSAGNVVSRFIYGSRMNVPDYMVKGGSVYRLATDHLGSVRLVVDTATGAIAQQVDYDEWGMATVVSGAGFQPFGFAGGLRDPLTGSLRFGQRDYVPETGRWQSKDPIGFAGGQGNLYSYNDPVNLIDPSGLFTVSLGFQAGGTLGVGFSTSFQISVSINNFNPFDIRLGVVGSRTWQVSTGASGAAGILLSLSGAESPSEFFGETPTVGGTVGEFLVGGLEVGNIGGKHRNYSLFLGEGLTGTLPTLPGEIHFGTSAAWGGSYTLNELLAFLICSAIR